MEFLLDVIFHFLINANSINSQTEHVFFISCSIICLGSYALTAFVIYYVTCENQNQESPENAPSMAPRELSCFLDKLRALCTSGARDACRTQIESSRTFRELRYLGAVLGQL